ncbi:hypothetical protein V5799_023410 [Amblyomma americanum]|uniref:Gamma-glutamyltransferase n=1 Tax=Amblyomma americanum TaxID=6943 RepID=A0AAQ4FJ72_AMBAM
MQQITKCSRLLCNVAHEFPQKIHYPQFLARVRRSHRYLDLHASGTHIVTAAALLVLLSTGLVLYLRVSMHRHAWRGKRPISNAPMGSFGRWAAIVGDENCKNVPRKILVKLNGTAADAAVATMLCVCVVLSHACGLGGGFFALHYKP